MCKTTILYEIKIEALTLSSTKKSEDSFYQTVFVSAYTATVLFILNFCVKKAKFIVLSSKRIVKKINYGDPIIPP